MTAPTNNQATTTYTVTSTTNVRVPFLRIVRFPTNPASTTTEAREPTLSRSVQSTPSTTMMTAIRTDNEEDDLPRIEEID